MQKFKKLQDPTERKKMPILFEKKTDAKYQASFVRLQSKHSDGNTTDSSHEAGTNVGTGTRRSGHRGGVLGRGDDGRGLDQGGGGGGLVHGGRVVHGGGVGLNRSRVQHWGRGGGGRGLRVIVWSLVDLVTGGRFLILGSPRAAV